MKLKYIKMAPDVIAQLPVTDIRHTLEEIDRHRHVLAMIEEHKKKYNNYKYLRT